MMANSWLMMAHECMMAHSFDGWGLVVADNHGRTHPCQVIVLCWSVGFRSSFPPCPFRIEVTRTGERKKERRRTVFEFFGDLRKVLSVAVECCSLFQFSALRLPCSLESSWLNQVEWSVLLPTQQITKGGVHPFSCTCHPSNCHNDRCLHGCNHAFCTHIPWVYGSRSRLFRFCTWHACTLPEHVRCLVSAFVMYDPVCSLPYHILYEWQFSFVKGNRPF